MKNIILALSLILLTSALSAKQSDIESANNINNEVSVVYLGHSGWAIKTNNNFLIFDYQEKYDFNWEKQPVKNLISGYIIPEEIKDYNVYVFTSHEHSDHYDPIILNWEKDIRNITYFFGWDFSSEDKYNCLKEPRSEYKDEIIEVYTINSHHSGVFESAFIIKIDGLSIYHNGDYKGDYLNDYQYLKSKTERIDIAFSNSDPSEDAQYFQQSKLLMGQFSIKHFFPMHSINKEKEVFKLLAKMYKNHGVQSMINCAEIKGNQFSLKMEEE